ncbi:HNH endonuclease [Streptomyces sp. NPDC002754]
MHGQRMSAKQGRNTAMFKRLVDQLKREYPWLCHLCGAPIPTGVHHTDPLAYTADHVVPMALAPWLAEDIENLRPAHRICNLRKGKNPNSRNRKFSRKWQ